MYYIYFLEEKTSCVSIPALLRFITGLSTIPPLGLAMPIRICFIDEIYPKAQACFSKLLLPTSYESQESFNMAFKKALEFGTGYGNL